MKRSPSVSSSHGRDRLDRVGSRVGAQFRRTSRAERAARASAGSGRSAAASPRAIALEHVGRGHPMRARAFAFDHVAAPSRPSGARATKNKVSNRRLAWNFGTQRASGVKASSSSSSAVTIEQLRELDVCKQIALQVGRGFAAIGMGERPTGIAVSSSASRIAATRAAPSPRQKARPSRWSARRSGRRGTPRHRRRRPFRPRARPSGFPEAPALRSRTRIRVAAGMASSLIARGPRRGRSKEKGRRFWSDGLHSVCGQQAYMPWTSSSTCDGLVALPSTVSAGAATLVLGVELLLLVAERFQLRALAALAARSLSASASIFCVLGVVQRVRIPAAACGKRERGRPDKEKTKLLHRLTPTNGYFVRQTHSNGPWPMQTCPDGL